MLKNFTDKQKLKLVVDLFNFVYFHVKHPLQLYTAQCFRLRLLSYGALIETNMATKSKSVLFVCLGNICRSPMAEFLFKDMVRNSSQPLSWRIDSAGYADWNEGCFPEELVEIVLSENSIPIGEHRARKIRQSDFDDFDFILTLDEAVMAKLVKEKPKNSKAKLELLRQYDPAQEIVKDPYCGTKADYEKVFRQCKVSLTNFLRAVTEI